MGTREDLASIYGVPPEDPRLDTFMQKAAAQGVNPLALAMYKRGQGPEPKRGVAPDAIMRPIMEEPRQELPMVRGRAASRPETAVLSAGQGLTSGLADEATASIMTYGVPTDDFGGRTGGEPGAGHGDYRRNLQGVRSATENARASNPGVGFGAELGGTFASPMSRIVAPVRHAGALANVARSALGGAFQGAVAGFGHSEAEDLPGLAKDTGVGMGIGAGAGTLVQGGAEGVRAVGRSIQDGLGRRILNEVAEGGGGGPVTTGTKRMRLDATEGNVLHVATEIPEAEAVRAAFTNSSARKGMEQLAPIIDGAGQQLDQGYAAFEAAGRGLIDPQDYFARLKQAAELAARGDPANGVPGGRLEIARGLDRLANDFRELVARTGGQVDLRTARGFTTQTQGAAASVLGSLNEHATAKLKNHLSAVASEAMSDSLETAAGTDPALRAALTSIRDGNRKMNGLLTISDAMKPRRFKEETAKHGLVRAAEQTAGFMGTGAALGAMGSENKIEGAIGGAVAGAAVKHGLPALARAAVRRTTTAGINAARGGGGLGFAAKVADVTSAPTAAVSNPLMRAAQEQVEYSRRLAERLRNQSRQGSPRLEGKQRP